jgi:CheY-like chemotaxis protein
MTQPTSDPSVPGARARILLVEDNQAAGRGLARLLETEGFGVTTVENGAAALAALGAGAPPNFLLTDLQLPDLDGRDLARTMRELVPNLRVVLITGWDFEPTQEEMTDPAIDRVMIKPVELLALVAWLRQALPTVLEPGSQ